MIIAVVIFAFAVGGDFDFLDFFPDTVTNWSQISEGEPEAVRQT